MMRKTNIKIVVLAEAEERKKGADSVLREIVAKNPPNLGKELDIPVQEANRTPYYLNAKRLPRHSLMKLSKNNDKERILKVAREKRK